MNPLTKRLLALGASSVIAVSGAYLVEPWESTKNQAYRDMVGIPTICAGYTIGVKMGDYKTDEECDKLLVKELAHFNTEMKKPVKVPLPEHMEIAYTSLVWNIGIGAWNNSTLLKKLNNKEYEDACKQILRWNKVTISPVQASAYQKRGEVCTQLPSGNFSCTVKGLTNRRTDEYKVCIGENVDVNKALQELSLSASNEEPLSVGINGLKTLENGEELPTPQPKEIIVSSHDTAGSKGAPEGVSGVVSGEVTKPSCARRFLGVLWCTSFN